MARLSKLILSFFAVVLLSGCQSIDYYAQSVVGHSKLMLSRVSVDQVIEGAEPELKRKLHLTQHLRKFASQQLALPDNNSYSTYVPLEREYPVWVVVAAPEFSLSANTWCYLVIGCASYRGYFSESAAHNFAHNLRLEGLETHVGGAPAYSTLGWFSDPILPSMIKYGDAYVAEMLFHELAHQVLYVKDDSQFNEAFASVVAEQGVLRWLNQHRPQAVESYRQTLIVRRDFSELIDYLKQGLEALYQSELSDHHKRVRKQQIIESFKHQYRNLQLERWGGARHFDNWLSEPINNARLAAYSTYHKMMPDLNTLFQSCESNFATFFQRLKKNQSLNDAHTCQ